MSELALKLIEKEKHELTGKLDLGNCGLTDFPDELFELDWIKELSFSSIRKNIGNEWFLSGNKGEFNEFRLDTVPDKFERLINLKELYLGDYIYSPFFIDCNFLGKLSDLQVLDLGGIRITDFSFLNGLIYLQSLNISCCGISDYSFLNKMSALQSLSLYESQITELSFLKSITTLKYLDLSSNKIKNCSSLSYLSKLESLDLSSNEVNDLSFLENLTALQSLDLSSTHISDFRILKNLTALQALDLSYNKISDYSFLEKHTSLQSLGLRGNEILDIHFLKKHTALQFLDLSENQIKDYSILEGLTSLQSLVINGNDINDYHFLKSLIALEKLSVNRNKIRDPWFLGNLTALKNIDISSNEISSLDFVEKLTALEFIDLTNNRINDISLLVPLLKQNVSIAPIGLDYEGIYIHDNPIINPPINIVEQGGEAILDWFEQIEKFGAEPFYESKLMILGQGESGKTTFANLQLNPDYKVEPGKIDTTLGIVVHRGKEFVHNTIGKPNIKAHLWDFGGQDIQKMLHQFFITENCLYVLVSNKRAENAGFDYWFQIISLLGPKSSVIVFENPKGSKGSNENFALKKYRELYPELVIETMEVNLSETRGRHQKKWGALNETIAEKLSEMEIVNRLVPKKWGLVRDELEKLKGQKYISKDSFYELCANPEIGLNHRQADWCLSYFRSLGDLVYFDDRDLCTHIFLDHNWLTQGMYYILSDKKIETSGGRFTRAQAYLKWDTNRYNEEEKAMLLRLLLKDKFDICYELTDEKDVFITPLLLPADKPAKKWDYETNLQFRYQYGFIPHGLFSRLIVKLHEKIDSEQHWKTGVRLKDVVDGKEVRAEVQQYTDPEENQPVIDIKISGDKNGSKQMLAFIRSAVDKLHKDFRNISAKEIVACNCKTCIERMKSGGKPSFYEFEMLREKIINRNYFVDCKESKWKPVNIGLILNDIVVENAANENRDSQLLKQLKEMGMSITQIINNSQGGSATATSTSTSSSNATASSTVTINIQTILGEVQSLKEDFEDERKLLRKSMNDDEIDVTIRDIEKAEAALQEIEAAQSQNQQPAPKSANRLKRFIDDLSDEKSTLHKGLKLLRKGKDYGVNLAETYNKIAPNIGLPSVPPLALDVIKNL